VPFGRPKTTLHQHIHPLAKVGRCGRKRGREGEVEREREREEVKEEKEEEQEGE